MLQRNMLRQSENRNFLINKLSGGKYFLPVFLHVRSSLIKLLFFAGVVLWGAKGWGQTTVFNTDFGTSGGSSYSTTAGAIGTSSTWSFTRSGADFGAKIDGGNLDLTNDASLTANVNGWVFGYAATGSFASPYNTTLNSNTAVTWTFNMRQIRADPAGFGAGSYGVAFVLAGSSTTAASIGNGYAVVLGQSGTTDPIRLVKYNSGLQGTVTNIISSNTSGLTDFGADYISIKVIYTASTNTWELLLRNDGSTAFADPASGTLTSQGTATDNSYTGTALGYLGGYWQGSTAASQTGFFDNVKVVVTSTSSYTVAYNANGGTGSQTDASSPYTSGSTVTVMGAGSIARSCYTFAGWNTKADGSGNDFAVGGTFAIDKDTTLFAKWSTATNYTITYDGNGNTGGTAPSTYTGGCGIVSLANGSALTRTGYTLQGWNTASNGSGTDYVADGTANYTISGNSVTMYAKWSINSYNLVYNGNGSDGGTVPVTQNGNYNTTLTVSNAGTMTRAGYTFTGWNSAADGTGTAYAPGANYTIPASNATLYAQWVLGTSYTVLYNGNGNTGGSAPVDGASPYTSGATVTVLNNTGSLVRTGYSFSGWNTQAGGGGTSYSPDNTFTIGANTTLYAQWTINNYNVVYDGNGNTSGSAPTTQTANYNASVTLSAVGSLVRTGYTFSGWNTAANGSGTAYAAGASYTIPAANSTLYAQWTINNYNVAYDGNGNTGGTAPTTQTANYNSSVTISAVGSLVRTGYTFSGWNTAANGSGTAIAAGANFVIPAANSTLYAQWSISNYNVVYDGNGNTGGTAPTTQSANYNTSVSISGVGSLAKTGFTFTGWNTASNGSGITYAAGASYTIPAANTTLYAQWTCAITTSPVATAATNVAGMSFTANWNSVVGATAYYVDVYTKTPATTTVSEGFSGGTTTPSGWTFNSIGGTYTSAGNFGASSPSLQMDATNDAITTPTFAGTATNLSIWLKGQG
jgi:uncharacterized repeat protein (TIGR02543 family)